MTRRLAKSVALVLFAASLTSAAPALADEPAFAVSELWIEGSGERHRFRVEIAETPAQQARGLMFRAEVAPDAGMLFDYGEPRHVTMWMKNTLVPLDMLFIDAEGAVVRVEGWTTPLSLDPISSRAPVVAVLELRGGTADRLGLGVGDRVSHPIFER